MYVVVFLLMAGTALAAIETGQVAGPLVVPSGGASMCAYVTAGKTAIASVNRPMPDGVCAYMLRNLLPATGETAGASGNAVTGRRARSNFGLRAG